jgi:hypothetical protein
MKQCCFVLITTCFFWAVAVSQTTVTLTSVADNTIYQTPSGNSNALGQNIFSGTNGGGSPRRGLIKFDVAAAVPAGAAITSVVLTLNCNVSRTISDNVSLHKLLSGWGEGSSNAGSTGDGAGAAATTNDATWLTTFYPNSFWSNTGGDFTASASASTSISGTGFYSWNSVDMVTDVQTWLSNPATNFGWILLCNETTTSTARRFASKENAVAINRPALTITYTTTLPVALTQFTAKIENAAVRLNWETSQEVNNRFFEIMHSRDGISFSAVGQMPGQGTSSVKHKYSFIHPAAEPGNHFYKLRQVDIDGNKRDSRILRVYIPPAYSDMKVVPNPVLNEFLISSTTNLQNSTYKILNQLGSVVLSGVTDATPVKTDVLQAGIYYLCLYKNKNLIGSISFVKR